MGHPGQGSTIILHFFISFFDIFELPSDYLLKNEKKKSCYDNYFLFLPYHFHRQIFEQYLYADLGAIGTGVLPNDVAKMHDVTLKGRYLLQVESLRT